MSIATDLTRLQTAKADLKTAIEGKGVTVPSATKIDGYASLVSSIPSGGGGGSGAVSLLDTITVPENARALRVDLEDYQNYNFLFVYLEDFVLTAKDWLYAVKNSTSGGSYNADAVDNSGIIALQYNTLSGQASAGTAIRAIGTGMSTSTGLFNYLYLYCYSASVNIAAGSKVKIYGGNYADM